MRKPFFAAIFLMFTLLGGSSCFATEVYRWTDKEGVTHFADTSPADGKADLIDVQNAASDNQNAAASDPINQQPQPTERPATDSEVPKFDDSTTAANKADVPYQSAVITSPQPDENIHDANGSVNVVVSIIPALKMNDNIQILLDGKTIGKPAKNTNYSLTDVDRGTHTLVATVVDESGQTVLKSDTVTFHLHRPSKLANQQNKADDKDGDNAKK